MHTYTDLYLAHPLETWTPFDIVVNSAYALLTYKPTNVVISPFIRYSGTSAYNIYIKVETFGGCCDKSLLLLRSSLVSFSCRLWPFGSLAVEELPDFWGISVHTTTLWTKAGSILFPRNHGHCSTCRPDSYDLWNVHRWLHCFWRY